MEGGVLYRPEHMFSLDEDRLLPPVTTNPLTHNSSVMEKSIFCLWNDLQIPWLSYQE